jgi:chaperone required for assembly of F1-ATPase
VSGWGPRKRVWSAAEAAPTGEGLWTVLLDGKGLRTPGRAAFAAPVRAVAEAAAAEWAAQGEAVDPRSMPVTRAVNTACDRVAPQIAAVRDEIAGYGGSDLLCYRAPHPRALAERQTAAWDPWLAWAERRCGARLLRGTGVTHVAQPQESLARLAAALAPLDAWSLTALHELVALSGSLVLGLAAFEGALDAEAAWAASRVDEDWQIEQWGEDAEAAEAAARRRADFAQAARLAAMLRSG